MFGSALIFPCFLGDLDVFRSIDKIFVLCYTSYIYRYISGKFRTALSTVIINT